MWNNKIFLNICIIFLFYSQLSTAQLVSIQEDFIRTTPGYYERALRNPMKGFTAEIGHEWATLTHVYIKWNELENHESDGLDKIIEVSNQKFENGPANNVKFIPRVYLHWNAESEKYWPEDMVSGDYTSEQFQSRVLRLIQRLGVAWNNDPRIAFIELGIFGKWGEHHSPNPTPEMQKIVGEAFKKAFPDKKVSVRHAWSEFLGLGFGEYWDSWAHYQQMWAHGHPISDMNRVNKLYLTNYIGGEVAYNWGPWNIQPGESPTESVSKPIHKDFIINSIRWLHGTQLRWISSYDQSDENARSGAEQIQKVFGYRFKLNEVGYSTQIDQGLTVELTVTNEGSAIFYYNWPLEVALHDPESREIVWNGSYSDVDIRSWEPGSNWTPPQWEEIDIWPGKAVVDGWSSEPIGWGNPPVSKTVSETFFPDLPPGEYVLSIAILDPSGMKPSLRFATTQYWNGGRHPLGLVGAGKTVMVQTNDFTQFDDPATDKTLNYEY